jgi:hypothetical protein
MTINNDNSSERLSLVVAPKLAALFFQLLGYGFSLNIRTGCSVKELLCNQLGINEDYLAQKIKTVFLNAKVVDDVNSAVVHEDATIALSGAMPGLVGAILRGGGYYAPMRSQISHEKNLPASRLHNGRITLKLMNIVLKELGSTFLERGIWIQGEEVRSLIERHRERFQTGCYKAELQDKPVEVDSLCKTDWNADLIFLQVSSG